MLRLPKLRVRDFVIKRPIRLLVLLVLVGTVIALRVNSKAQETGEATFFASTSLTIYAEPSINSDQVGTLQLGQASPVIGRNAIGTWYQVELNNTSGWVCAEFGISNNVTAEVPITSDRNEDCNGKVIDSDSRVDTLREDIRSWPVHVDEILDFSVQYPPDWFLTAATSTADGSSTTLANFNFVDADPIETTAVYTQGGTKIEFGNHPVPYNPGQDLVVWVQENFLSEHRVVISEKVVENGQFTGIQLQVTDEDGLLRLGVFFPRNGIVFLVWAIPETPEVQTILSTLQI